MCLARRTPFVSLSLILVSIGLLAACDEPIPVDGRLFYCEQSSDCLDGYTCEPRGDRKACVPLAEADAGPTRDAEPDAPSDVGPDAPLDAGVDAAADASPDVRPDAQPDATPSQGCATSAELLAASVSVGYDHVCMVEKDTYEVYCWGADAKGQLGDGPASNDAPRAVPVRVDQSGLNGSVVDVSAGYELTCGRVVGGTDSGVYCWGANDRGQVGDATRGTIVAAPSPVAGLDVQPSIQSVAAGGLHACATNGRDIYCWGANAQGQIGRTDLGEDRLPVEGFGAAAATPSRISAGAETNCALVGEDIYCWGREKVGETGDGTASQAGSAQARTIAASSGSDWRSSNIGVDVSVGVVEPEQSVGASACAIDRDSQVFCWGDASHGVVEVGAAFASSPQLITELSAQPTYESVTVGARHACVLDASGRAYCWGSNDKGQLGHGDLGSVLPAAPVDTELRFEMISAGGGATCGVTPDGAVYCWGDGRLDGVASIDESAPTLVPRRVACANSP